MVYCYIFWWGRGRGGGGGVCRVDDNQIFSRNKSYFIR